MQAVYSAPSRLCGDLFKPSLKPGISLLSPAILPSGQAKNCAVVLGTTIPGTVVRQIGTGTIQTTRTTTTVFVLSVPPPALFYVSESVDGNSSSGLREESRPVPVVSVTISENKTGPASLVGPRVRRVGRFYYLLFHRRDAELS